MSMMTLGENRGTARRAIAIDNVNAGGYMQQLRDIQAVLIALEDEKHLKRNGKPFSQALIDALTSYLGANWMENSQ